MRSRQSPARVGLVAACDDPQLFGFPLWPVQRRLLEAVEAGPRMHVWALGRRSAKTTSAALVMLWCCLLRPELLGSLRPGERAYAVGVATNLRQARLLVRAAVSIVERSPLLAPLIESATDDEVTFANGTAITAFPCTSRGGRGWPVFCLVLDELAHFVDTDGNEAAASVWSSLLPSTAQFGAASRVIASSTPYGDQGLFAQLYAQAVSGELADAAAQQASTAEANPTVAPAFLEAERARDPDGFLSEYEARFVGGGASFLDPDRIADAVADRGELAPDQATGWVAGLDPAFSSDPFGLALVGRDLADRSRLVLGVVRAWKPARRKPGSFEDRRELEDAVLAEVAAVCQRYGARVVTDQYAAPAIVDRLRRAGLWVRTVPMTAVSKTEAFVELRARLYTRSLELYGHRDLLVELRRLRSRFTAGQSGVVNPRVGGSHGDLAQALALAVFEQDRRGVRGGTREAPPVVEATADKGRRPLVDLGRRRQARAPGLGGFGDLEDAPFGEGAL